ncbi:MAG: hypothetical protein V3U49_02445 [Nitrososphaerales archaeon]
MSVKRESTFVDRLIYHIGDAVQQQALDDLKKQKTLEGAMWNIFAAGVGIGVKAGINNELITPFPEPKYQRQLPNFRYIVDYTGVTHKEPVKHIVQGFGRQRLPLGALKCPICFQSRTLA